MRLMMRRRGRGLRLVRRRPLGYCPWLEPLEERRLPSGVYAILSNAHNGAVAIDNVTGTQTPDFVLTGAPDSSDPPERLLAQRFNSSLSATGPLIQVPVPSAAGVQVTAAQVGAAGGGPNNEFVLGSPTLTSTAAGASIGVNALLYASDSSTLLHAAIPLLAPALQFPAGVNSFANVYSSAAMDPSGAFVVAEDTFADTNAPTGFMEGDFSQLQIFDAQGNAKTAAITLTNVPMASNFIQAAAPVVAMDNAGDVVVVFDNNGQLQYQRFNVDSHGNYVAGTVTNIGPTPSGPFASTIQFSAAMDAAGDFVVAWDQNGTVKAQVVPAQGPLPSPITVATSSSEAPAVGMDALGDFVVAYDGPGPSGNLILDAQYYSHTGGAPQAIQGLGLPSDPNVSPGSPAVAMNAAGWFVVALDQYFSVPEGIFGVLHAPIAPGASPQADVTVDKEADQPTINAGDTAGYSLDIINTGGATATGLTLNDPLPAGAGKDINWQIDTTTGTPSDFQITGSVGNQSLVLKPGLTLAVGHPFNVHITGVTTFADAPSPTFSGTLVNTATVNASNEPAADQNQQASASITVLGNVSPPPPDVEVFKTADDPFISPGQTAGFTVEIENLGSFPATGVTLNDPLPGGAGHDINWTIDPSTGMPADFQITGSVGNQTLTLAPGFGSLAGFQPLAVHITGLTSLADAPNVFQSSGGYTIETGQLDNTATVSAANEPLALQNQQASASIDLLGQTPPSISPASNPTSGSSSPSSSSSVNATVVSAIQQPAGPSPAATLATIPLSLLTQVNAAGLLPAPANPLYALPQYNPSPGPTFTTITPGLAPMPGDISGVVFLDRNGNGVREQGDTGIAGVTVFIDRHGDGLFHQDDPQAVTNDKGEYVFHGLPLNSTYQVRPKNPQFMLQTYPQKDGAQIVTLSDDHPAETDVTFGTMPYRPLTQPIRPVTNPEKEAPAPMPAPPRKSGETPGGPGDEQARNGQSPQAARDAVFDADTFWQAGLVPFALLAAYQLGQRRSRRRGREERERAG